VTFQWRDTPPLPGSDMWELPSNTPAELPPTVTRRTMLSLPAAAMPGMVCVECLGDAPAESTSDDVAATMLSLSAAASPYLINSWPSTDCAPHLVASCPGGTACSSTRRRHCRKPHLRLLRCLPGATQAHWQAASTAAIPVSAPVKRRTKNAQRHLPDNFLCHG
jgi:hypothetical protein